jgi:ABC-type nickel/cobalt efflux system permease component RcnA
MQGKSRFNIALRINKLSYTTHSRARVCSRQAVSSFVLQNIISLFINKRLTMLRTWLVNILMVTLLFLLVIWNVGICLSAETESYLRRHRHRLHHHHHHHHHHHYPCVDFKLHEKQYDLREVKTEILTSQYLEEINNHVS